MIETVPCSKCVECKKRRASAWSYRLMQEAKVSSSAYFITLTYDTKHVPITKSGYMDISKRDLQLFFKRLRKAHASLDKVGKPLKYYAVGEFGGRTFRPHYHVILFNASLDILIGEVSAGNVRRRVLELNGKFNFSCKTWSLGHMTVGQVSGASVGYTLKYISKVSKIPLHRNDDRTPEFSLMSKGLGIDYLTPAMIRWHKADLENRMYVNLEDGKVASMPRYYKDKLYNQFERDVAGYCALQKMKFQKEKDISKLGNGKYYRNRSESHFAQQEQAKKDQSKNQSI